MFTKFAGFVTVIALTLGGAALVASPADASVAATGSSKVGDKKANKRAGHKAVGKKAVGKKAKRKAKGKRAKRGRSVAAAGHATPQTSVQGRVGPGSSVAVGDRACTIGFLFRQVDRHFASVSANCVGRALGESVTIKDAGVDVASGKVAFRGADDFGLIEVTALSGVVFDGSVPGWGGPVGPGVMPEAGGTAYFATPNGVRTAALQNDAGRVVALAVPDQANAGAGLLDATGHAIGLLDKSGNVIAMSLVLDRALGAGFAGLQVVSGGAFQTAAVG